MPKGNPAGYLPPKNGKRKPRQTKNALPAPSTGTGGAQAPDAPKGGIGSFLSIRRDQGLGAARKFAALHKQDMASGAKAAHGQRPYKARRKKGA